MLEAITHLIDYHTAPYRHLIATQMRSHVYADFQKLPYWLGEVFGFQEVEDWLRNVWMWSHNNAYNSHQDRPWHPDNLHAYRCSQNPDEFPF